MANIIVITLVLGYSAYLLRKAYKMKKDGKSIGCAGCSGECGSCAGCTGYSEDKIRKKE